MPLKLPYLAAISTSVASIKFFRDAQASAVHHIGTNLSFENIYVYP